MSSAGAASSGGGTSTATATATAAASAAATDAAATAATAATAAGVWSPPDPVPLQDFVAGHTLREAHRIFEAGLNPVVKGAMKAAFPTDETDPADPYVAALAAAAAEEAAALLKIKVTDLPAARKRLADTIAAKAAAGAAGGGSKVMKDANKAVANTEAKVRKLEDQVWVLDRVGAAAEAARTRDDELPAAITVFKESANAAAASPARSAAKAKENLGRIEARLWKLEGLERRRADIEAAAGVPLEWLVLTATEDIARKVANKATPPLGRIDTRNDGDNLWRAIEAARAAIETAKTRPVPRWLEKCRDPFSPKMASFMHDDGVLWDVFTLTMIIQAFLPEVFMPRLGCQRFRAKELLIGVLHAAESRNRRAHSDVMEHMMPSEAEALDAMQHMGDVLAHCGCADAAAKMALLLSSTQALVERAQAAAQDGAAPPTTTPIPTTTETVSITGRESANLVRYRAQFDFENRLRAAAGEFHFLNGTISFGTKQDGTIVNTWEAGRKERIQDKEIKPRFKRIALTRNLLFHGMSAPSTLVDDLDDMGVVLHRLDGIKDGAPATVGYSTPSDWSWKSWITPVGTATVNLAVTLQIIGQRMSIPKFREQCLVGRATEIDKVVGAALADDHSRVLIHGPPGMGKDVTAAEAVLHIKIKLNPALTMQAWLQGSTDEMFRRQLVRLFNTQRPKVIRGSENDQPTALAKIRVWLAANPSCWLFVVEDANAESKAIWTCLPPRAGRVIFTSVEDLATVEVEVGAGAGNRTRLGVTKAIELAPLRTDDSIEMWRKMSLFALKLSDVDLTEPEIDLEARCTAAKLVYTAPATSTENANARKQRYRSLQGALREHAELSHPDVSKFLDEEIGNLPLAVALNGQIIRDIGSVAKLIGLLKTAKLEEVDVQGRNRVTDRHLLGLYASVRVAVERIKAEPSLSEAEKRTTMQLLVIMSVLPGSETPAELFRHGKGLLSAQLITRGTKVVMHGLAKTAAFNGRVGSIVQWMAAKGSYKVDFSGSVYSVKATNLRGLDGSASHLSPHDGFETAVATLRQYGLLQRSEAGSNLVGNMHQLVQRCVRERIVKDSDPVVGESATGDASAIAMLRSALRTQFVWDGDPKAWGKLRELAPCVAQFWNVLDKRGARGAGTDEGAAGVLEATSHDCDLLMHHGILRHHADGDPKGAGVLEEETLAFLKRVLPPDHPNIATSMNNLASTYGALGRHDEAVVLQEETLAFQKRVLPPDHPDIATSMNNLALTYGALGRHDEAVALQEETLAFQKRVLPPDHPDIAM